MGFVSHGAADRVRTVFARDRINVFAARDSSWTERMEASVSRSVRNHAFKEDVWRRMFASAIKVSRRELFRLAVITGVCGFRIREIGKQPQRV